ncbi:hypothetical protein SAMN05216436_101154 [bacterium A37T11]|nr:hypothetical protein SAMN05216436_101154 [bacterium A37T11]
MLNKTGLFPFNGLYVKRLSGLTKGSLLFQGGLQMDGKKMKKVL